VVTRSRLLPAMRRMWPTKRFGDAVLPIIS
jgi:hypothetical protein